MKVLLSIKPEFANKIFEGSKKYEFRRMVFKDKSVTKVIVYASSPISRVIGEFDIETVIRKDLDELWDETKEFSGITRDFYDSYFQGKEEGYAIQVRRAKKYKRDYNIQEKFGVRAPQSFVYVA